ncbi:type 1 glutamine amidotransferase [Prochlorococcus marinus]|uniref:type 1 glutamine amidotransferase n=1 Tax=Prochlorococcus marinus TaxID=1219 RepID=UPI002FBE6F56
MARLIVLQHIEREGPGLFEKIALERSMNVNIFRLYLGEPIPNIYKDDLLLVMGGSMGVSDISNNMYPWLLDEVNLLKNALKNNIKIIGICLGAQLLAYAAGGKVEPLSIGHRMKKKAEVGWGNVFF